MNRDWELAIGAGQRWLDSCDITRQRGKEQAEHDWNECGWREGEKYYDRVKEDEKIYVMAIMYNRNI